MKIDFYGLFSVDIVYALTAIAAVALLALVVAIIAVFKASSMKKRYNTFMQGEDGKTVERLVKDNLDSIRELKTISEENKRNIKDIYGKMQFSFQKLGLIKYDAFHEMGGKLSFALCMLDKRDCGYIINVMHSNNGCFAYTKEIVKGKSYIDLGAEEQKALDQALAGSYGDAELSEKVNKMLEN